MEVVSDTGGIYAIYDVRDEYHAAVMRLISAETRIILPTPLLGELGYLLGARLGPRALSIFLQDLADGVFALEPFLPEDVRRCRELVDKYADLELGLTDAAVIATAERLNINQILSVDERDFRPIHNARGARFILLPVDETTS